MPKKSKSSRSNENVSPEVSKIIIGSLIGTFLFFVIIALFSVAALKTDVISSSSYMPLGLISGALSSFLGGFVTVRPIRKKGALLGTMTGLFQAFLTSAIVLFINGKNSGTGIIILMLFITAFGFLGAISAVNLKVKKKYK